MGILDQVFVAGTEGSCECTNPLNDIPSLVVMGQTVQDFMLHMRELRPEWKKEGTCLSLGRGVDGSPRLTE